MSTELENSLVTHSKIERVSVGENGTEGNSFSGQSTMSGDGRYVSFSSDASNLVLGDTNNTSDIFVYDRELNTTERVSINENGIQGNDYSEAPSISGDGRYVTFHSPASNLVQNDIDDTTYDVFVYDRELNTTERVSVGENGTQGNSASGFPSISGDGRYVTFHSDASNLVPGDTNNTADIFVYDRDNNTTERVSVGENGTQASSYSFESSISGDGRYVTFHSEASNLVPGDTNGVGDVFVYDRELNTTERVSVGKNNTQASSYSYDSSMSGDGRYITFSSDASNLVEGDANNVQDVFVYDRELNTTERVSVGENGTQGNNYSYASSISGDGRYVTFESFATNLVEGDTNNTQDVFVYDRELNTTKRVSVDDSGNEGFGWSPSISEDGRYVTFSSLADNLVEADTNDIDDVFVVENPLLNHVPIVQTEIPDQIISNTDTFSLDVSKNFSDVDAQDQLSFTAKGLPRGLSISANGSISGTAPGIYPVTITAKDLSNASVSDTFKLTVQSLAVGTLNDDLLQGNDKPNQIDGLAGDDDISGFGSDDLLFGGEGQDYLKGYWGNDRLEGDAGDDTLSGSLGIDSLYGSLGNDALYGASEADVLHGGIGEDTLYGSLGADLLSGAADNDTIYGGTQNDTLFGGTGNDLLLGAIGLDELHGDEGADIFVLQPRHGYGLDTISDFNLNEDLLQLSTNFNGSLGLSETDGNTTISVVGEQGERAIAILQEVTDVSLTSLGLGIK